MPRGHLPLIYLACPTLVTTACSVGPNYKRPEVRGPSAQLPIDTSYELSVWGQIRRNMEANIARAQASTADLETTRLSIHAEKVFDRLAKRVSTRRGGRPVPPPSPVETA
jgi:hypothetical protein